jgi:hypothetical protein
MCGDPGKTGGSIFRQYGWHDCAMGTQASSPAEDKLAGPYEAFSEQLKSRHQNPMTSGLSTVGDVFLILGFLVATIGRKYRLGAFGVLVGVSAAVVAHLFQPGTLKDELAAIYSHPLWAAKAERQRVFR